MTVCWTVQNIQSWSFEASARANDSPPTPMLNSARITAPTSTPVRCRSKPNGVTTATMIAACASIGTTSLSARPTSSEERLSGETSSRSCEPDCISCIRLAPVIDAPISAVIAMMPGTNHCRAEPLSTSGSSGENSARNTSGCTIAITSVAGSRSIGRSSRVNTIHVSARNVGW